MGTPAQTLSKTVTISTVAELGEEAMALVRPDLQPLASRRATGVPRSVTTTSSPERARSIHVDSSARKVLIATSISQMYNTSIRICTSLGQTTDPVRHPLMLAMGAFWSSEASCCGPDAYRTEGGDSGPSVRL